MTRGAARLSVFSGGVAFVMLAAVLAMQPAAAEVPATPPVLDAVPSVPPVIVTLPRSPTAIVVELRGLEEMVLPSITPAVEILVTDVAPGEVPARLGLQVSTSAEFAGALVLDTSVVASEIAQIRLARPLASGATLSFRAYAQTASGQVTFSPVVAGRMVPVWLVLRSPDDANGPTLESRRPLFIWSGGPVDSPPGPWSYDFRITSSASGLDVFAATTSDTSFTPPFDLEFNTSYRWSVTARLATGDSIRVTSISSFVIVDENTPRVTLLYQNFPNPFPSATSAATCIWFDLRTSSNVSLDIYDIRTNHVKRILPAEGGPRRMEAGRYGRNAAGSGGCAPELSWDGTDESGRRVTPGVYLLRLRADGVETIKRIVFRGP